MRTFETGATRDADEDKLDYEGFLHPLVIERFAEYMHKHRKQADGKLRNSDNWQKGIPQDAYMKSKYRHFMETWKWHRGVGDDIDIEEALCAELFNTMGMLLEILKEGRDEILDACERVYNKSLEEVSYEGFDECAPLDEDLIARCRETLAIGEKEFLKGYMTEFKAEPAPPTEEPKGNKVGTVTFEGNFIPDPPIREKKEESHESPARNLESKLTTVGMSARNFIYDALREISKRIELCGASQELTSASSLTCDLLSAIGNRYNPRDTYAEQRVAEALTIANKEDN